MLPASGTVGSAAAVATATVVSAAAIKGESRIFTVQRQRRILLLRNLTRRECDFGIAHDPSVAHPSCRIIPVKGGVTGEVAKLGKRLCPVDSTVVLFVVLVKECRRFLVVVLGDCLVDAGLRAAPDIGDIAVGFGLCLCLSRAEIILRSLVHAHHGQLSL